MPLAVTIRVHRVFEEMPRFMEPNGRVKVTNIFGVHSSLMDGALAS